jgi:hypothetical protein
MNQSGLTKEQLLSVRESYFNILAMFFEREEIESRFTRCLLKWGFQLHLDPEDLNVAAHRNLDDLMFRTPDRVERLEAIYHLVYMIYLDRVVEDVELEVAIIYAERLGFRGEVVSELFKSIATADYDQSNPHTVRQEVIDFLKLHEEEYR